MKCPMCGASIVAPAERCRECGLKFGPKAFALLSARYDLFAELRTLAESRDRVSRSIDRLANQLIALDALCAEALAEADLAARRALAAGVGAPPPAAEAGEAPPAAPPPPETEGRTPPPAGARSPLDADWEAVAASGTPPSPASSRPTPPPRPRATLFDDAPPPTPAGPPSGFETSIGEKWLLVLGILVVLFGVIYFVSYSIEQGWIGPAGQVTLAFLLGAGMLGAGARFHATGLPAFGLKLMGGAIGVLYIASWAAYGFYSPPLIPMEAAFLLMIVVTGLAGALAVTRDARSLAVIGAVGGFLTPVMLSTGRDDTFGLFTYMTVLNAGILGVSYRKRWPLLQNLGFLFTWLLVGGWMAGHYRAEKFWSTLLFLNVYYLVYSAVPFAMRVRAGETRDVSNFLLVVLNSFVAFGFNYGIVRERFGVEWVAAVSLAYAATFLWKASLLVKRGEADRDSFVVLAGSAALFLVVTIPLVFSGPWITVFWAAQAATLAWMAARLGRPAVAKGAYAILAVFLAKYLFYDFPQVFGAYGDLLSLRYSQGWAGGLAPRLAAEASVCGALLFMALLALRRNLRSNFSTSDSDLPDAAVLFTLLAGTLLYTLTVETGSFFGEYLPAARHASLSVLWALYAFALLGLGFRFDIKAPRGAAILLFGFTLLKVYTVDAQDLAKPWRVLSYIGLGFLMIGASFLYHRRRRALERAERQDPPGGIPR